MTPDNEIVSAELFMLSVPYRRVQEWTTGGREAAASYLVARVTTRAGRQGAAEIHCKPAWNGVVPTVLGAVFEGVAWPLLRERGLPDALAGHRLGRFIRDQGALSCLLDNLCRDLWAGDGAAASGAPTAVPAMAVLTRGTPELMRDEAAEAVAHGYRALKVKLGQGLRIDAKVLQEVRRSAGDGVVIGADANGAYRHEEAAALAEVARGAGVAFLEDPAPIEPSRAGVAGLAASEVPVLVDRYCDSLRAARAFGEIGLRHFAAKPGRIGQTEAEAVAAHAESLGGRVLVGMFGESMAGVIAQLRMAAGRACVGFAETGFHESLAENFLKEPLRFENGAHVLPGAPHLVGLMDWDRLGDAALSHIVLENDG